ncbi:hypothetical protein [Streptomyces aquilus]|uniref:hypothetical protein n=1 Tax=Streptomyces aquilus TaxID=2548456 RepID=UPI00369298FE
MNQATGRSADQVARGLAYVCEHRSYIERTIAQSSDEQRAALTRLTDPAGTTDVAADLEKIHRALRTARDSLGVYGQAGVRGLVHPVGVEQEPFEPVLRCPRREYSCTRFAQPGPGAVSRCELTDMELVRGELQQ